MYLVFCASVIIVRSRSEKIFFVVLTQNTLTTVSAPAAMVSTFTLPRHICPSSLDLAVTVPENEGDYSCICLRPSFAINPKGLRSV